MGKLFCNLDTMITRWWVIAVVRDFGLKSSWGHLANCIDKKVCFLLTALIFRLLLTVSDVYHCDVPLVPIMKDDLIFKSDVIEWLFPHYYQLANRSSLREQSIWIEEASQIWFSLNVTLFENRWWKFEFRCFKRPFKVFEFYAKMWTKPGQILYVQLLNHQACICMSIQ